MEKKWVAVFLIYADFIDENKGDPKVNGDLLLELNSLLKDVIECKFDTSKSKIYVILSSLNYEVVENANAKELKNLTFIFRVDPGTDFNRVNCIDRVDKDSLTVADKEDGTASVQKKEKVAEAFKIIREDNGNDNDEILLVTWDHGSAFGIFKSEAHKFPQMIPWQRVAENASFPYVAKFILAAEDYLHANNLALPKQTDDKQTFIANNRVYSLKSNNKAVNGIAEKLLSDAKTNTFFSIVEENSKHFIRANKNAENFFKPTNKNIRDHSQIFDLQNDINFADFIFTTFEVEPIGVVEILTNDELSFAIKEGFSKVSVLLMMNCFMMNLHTICAMRAVVEYLVAPQGVISIPGYNYEDILKEIINSKPGTILNSQEVAKSCVDTCHNSRAKAMSAAFRIIAEDDFAEIDEWSIFSVGLNESTSTYITALDKFLKKFDAFLEELSPIIASAPEIKYLFKYARRFCFDFTNGAYYMTDISHWLKNVEYAGLGIDPGIKNTISGLSYEIGQIQKPPFFIDKRGKNYADNTQGSVSCYPESGISLFFPDIPLQNIKIPFLELGSDPVLTKYLKGWNNFLNVINS